MKTKWKLILALIVGLVAGFWLGGSRSSHDHGAAQTAVDDKETTYTCSMHPQIRQPGPGKCPICAMDLIPVGDDGEADAGPRAISMSPAARELARIETAEVTRREAVSALSLSGKIAYDSTRLRDVALLSDGQVRTLHANVLGMRVASGDRLAEIYSPDVFAASRELVVSTSGSSVIADAARRKLRLLGMDEQEIDKIAKSGEASETYTIRSPINGVITEISGNQGQWLMRGDPIAKVADPSSVWVLLDVYEHDIGTIKTGQTVEVIADALGEEMVTGVVSFIPPDLDEMTRSVKVRVDVPNANGQLKPGMLARAKLNVHLADSALLVPATAVLRTGKRAVVYVQSPDDASVFEGREVTIGPRADDHYVITGGLTEGEIVVTRGAMRIDSSLQILAKPSMMSMATDGKPRPQTHCPVEGGKIDRADFIDYQGMRIYFCCPGCDEDFSKDPEKYLAEMRAKGIEPERIDGEEGGHEQHH